MRCGGANSVNMNKINILFMNITNGWCFNLLIRLFDFLLNLLLRQGISIENMNIIVYVYGLIADEPGRAKICSHKQHNGKLGCIFCLNEGIVMIYINYFVIFINVIKKIRSSYRKKKMLY